VKYLHPPAIGQISKSYLRMEEIRSGKEGGEDRLRAVRKGPVGKTNLKLAEVA